MSTDAPTSPMDRLSPFWSRRPLSKRQSSSRTTSRPTTSNGLLSPQPASAPPSDNSDELLPIDSARVGRRASLRNMVGRIRSTSNASTVSNRSQDSNGNEIDNWFYGFRRYNQLVSTRTLSDQATTSQDLAKGMKALSKSCGGHFLHGLSEAAFDFSLLWCPADKLSSSSSSSSSPSNPEPSWSWQSYPGPVNFPFDPTTCPEIYTTPRSSGEYFRSELTNLHLGPEHDPYTVRRDKSSALRIKYPPYFHAPRGADPTADSHTLRFTASTISASAFTAEQLHYQGSEIPCSQLLDSHNADAHCGLIMHYEAAIAEPSATGPFEFVLLSRSLRCEPAEHTRRPSGMPLVHPPGTPIWHAGRFVWDEEIAEFDESMFAPGPWSVLNVMLIKWVGGFAERVAIARIHEDAWMKRGPVRKEIVLR